MDEVWKPVAGYEGLYEVSNFGNVKSINWRKKGCSKNLWLKPHPNGYLQVELAKDGTRRFFTVHRLVANAFLSNPLGLPQVNHRDENKKNNCVENLEWCTASYNTKYSIERRKNVEHREFRGRNSKYKHSAVLQISVDGNVVKEWENPRAIFLETGMSDWSISECCRGKRKTAYGYKWQYAN